MDGTPKEILSRIIKQYLPVNKMAIEPTTASKRISTRTGIVMVLAVTVLTWFGVRLYHRLFDLPEAEKQFRAIVNTEYAKQTQRQEAITRWTEAGIIKRIAKHGPVADLFVGPPYFKCDSITQEKIAETIYWVYIMEDKSFREVVIRDFESAKPVRSYGVDGFQTH